MEGLRFLSYWFNELAEVKVAQSLIIIKKQFITFSNFYIELQDLKNSFPFSSGTSLGSTCKHAVVTCPGGKTTYPATCSLGCPKDYSIKGSSTITCQTSGQWSSYATSYCRRDNDPPTQVSASDEHLTSPYNVIVFLYGLVKRIARMINQ